MSIRYGVRLKVDVTKIDKALLFKGQKGVYLDATLWLSPEQESQYGDHGMITQDVSKEAREAGEKGPILGNAKVFFTEGGGTSPQAAGHAKTHASNTQQDEDFSDPIPF